MAVPHADSDFSNADYNLVPYRAVSGWAVAALVLGALSALALVGPMLWAIPLLGVMAALVAMRKINASVGELVGWNMALLGLLLALLFGVAAPARTITRRYWLETRADLFAGQFVDLLQQDRGDAAYQFTMIPALRKPFDTDLAAEYAKDPRTQKNYGVFLQREPVNTLLANHGQITYQRLGAQWIDNDENRDRLVVRYRISRTENKEGGATLPHAVRLTLIRGADPRTGDDQWKITSINSE